MIKGITREPVIVGIDPGTTSAVAVLDLDHNLKDYKSSKNFSKDQIIEFIISHGKPLFIATDVASLPSLIEGIASNMGAETVVPSDDLQSQYKEDITNQYAIPGTDPHVMDAVAAAEYAYREHEDKIQGVLRKAEAAGLDRDDQFEVVQRVLTGSRSVQTVINDVQDNNEDTEQAEDNQGSNPDRERDWKRIAERRQQQIEQLQTKVDNLDEYNETLEERLSDAEQQETVTDDELRKRNREINRLRQQVEEKQARLEQVSEENKRLREALQRVTEQDWLYVPEADDLSRTTTDIVYCDTYSGGAVNDTVDTVITGSHGTDSGAYKSLQDQGITVVDTAELEKMIRLETGIVVHPEDVNTATSAATDDSERFKEWLESYRKRQTTSQKR